MAFKRSAVRSRLSPPTTDRKANALRSCSIYGSDTPPRFPQQLNQVHYWRPFSIRRWALFYFINDGGKIDMNDHSKDSQTRYLREAAIVLAKEGFQSDEIHADRLCIQLDGSPLCEVTESGGVAYRNEDIDEPDRIAAKDKVYEIVRTTAEYMRQMENGARFESRWFRGRLQGAGRFQRHCAGRSPEQTRSPLCHMGLGLWAHRRMS